MAGFRFSRIVIIQSLSSGNSPTGRALRDAIEPTANALYNVPVEFIETPTANEFWSAIERVQKNIKHRRGNPILHFECHGLSDKTGLSLADKTPVTWLELKNVLMRLNRETCCNLLVTLAACQGARLMETLDVLSSAPCYGIVGPSGDVSPPDLISSYSAFFVDLLNSKNLETAFISLKDAPACKAQYFLFTAEDMFRDVFRLYRVTCSTKEQMTDRADRFTQIVKKLGMPGDELGSILPLLYGIEQEFLGKFYRQFFYVDSCPKNELRFANAYAALGK